MICSCSCGSPEEAKPCRSDWILQGPFARSKASQPTVLSLEEEEGRVYFVQSFAFSPILSAVPKGRGPLRRLVRLRVTQRGDVNG